MPRGVRSKGKHQEQRLHSRHAFEVLISAALEALYTCLPIQLPQHCLSIGRQAGLHHATHQALQRTSCDPNGFQTDRCAVPAQCARRKSVVRFRKLAWSKACIFSGMPAQADTTISVCKRSVHELCMSWCRSATTITASSSGTCRGRYGVTL